MGLFFNSKKPEPPKKPQYGWPFDEREKKHINKLSPKQQKELARKKWLAEQEEEDELEELDWFDEGF